MSQQFGFFQQAESESSLKMNLTASDSFISIHNPQDAGKIVRF